MPEHEQQAAAHQGQAGAGTAPHRVRRLRAASGVVADRVGIERAIRLAPNSSGTQSAIMPSIR